MDWISVLGFVAATLTTGSFLPQTMKVIRSKCTKDLSFGMYLLLVIGLFSWIVYGIFVGSWPVIIANAVTLIFASIILFLKIKYK